MRERLLALLFLLVCLQFAFAQQSKTSRIQNEKLLEYYQTPDFRAAAEYLKSSYPEGERDSLLHAQLGYVLLMSGELSESEAEYLKIISMDSANVSARLQLGNISLLRGNKSKAKAYFNQVLDLDSLNFDAYKALAGLYPAEPAAKKLAYLKEANHLNPYDAEVAGALGVLYTGMERFEDARSVLDTALALDSANLNLIRLKIPIDFASGKYKEVIYTGTQLLKEGDSSSFVFDYLARTYYHLIDYTNALNCYLHVNEQDEDRENLYFNIARSYRGVGNYVKAVEYLKKAINEGVSSRAASYYGLLGDSYENLKKNEDANAAYKKGLDFENDGSLLYNIALLYEKKLNDKKNAIDYYEQYLKTINPDKKARQVKYIKSKIEELKR